MCPQGPSLCRPNDDFIQYRYLALSRHCPPRQYASVVTCMIGVIFAQPTESTRGQTRLSMTSCPSQCSERKSIENKQWRICAAKHGAWRIVSCLAVQTHTKIGKCRLDSKLDCPLCNAALLPQGLKGGGYGCGFFSISFIDCSPQPVFYSYSPQHSKKHFD